MERRPTRYINPAYDPLRAPIERARNNPDCDAARRDLAAFAHQPEPQPRGWLREEGWGIVASAIVIIVVIALL